jgi:hypothetical protein
VNRLTVSNQQSTSFHPALVHVSDLLRSEKNQIRIGISRERANKGVQDNTVDFDAKNSEGLLSELIDISDGKTYHLSR